MLDLGFHSVCAIPWLLNGNFLSDSDPDDDNYDNDSKDKHNKHDHNKDNHKDKTIGGGVDF